MAARVLVGIVGLRQIGTRALRLVCHVLLAFIRSPLGPPSALLHATLVFTLLHLVRPPLQSVERAEQAHMHPLQVHRYAACVLLALTGLPPVLVTAHYATLADTAPALEKSLPQTVFLVQLERTLQHVAQLSVTSAVWARTLLVQVRYSATRVMLVRT